MLYNGHYLCLFAALIGLGVLMDVKRRGSGRVLGKFSRGIGMPILRTEIGIGMPILRTEFGFGFFWTYIYVRDIIVTRRCLPSS